MGKHNILIPLIAISVAFCVIFFHAEAAEAASRPTSEQIPQLHEIPFHKGVNINAWFDRPASEVNPGKISDKEIDGLKSLGMDVVRVPVNFHSNAGNAPGYTLDESYLKNLDAAVELITSRGMWVILDHHSLSTETFPTDGEQLIISCLRQLSLRYKGQEKIALELFNEPFGDYLKAHWPAMQGRIIKAVRACDSNRILIATPWGCYPERLSELPDYNDPRVIYTFHYYNPLIFTHQQAYWDENLVHLSGYPFPYDATRMPAIHPEWQKEPYLTYLYNYYPQAATVSKIREEISAAADWAEANGKLLYCGEFGVLNTGRPSDRYKWYKAVGNILAERNIPWTLWQYKDEQLINFSIFTGAQTFEQLDTDMMEALGITLPEKYSGVMPLTIYGDSVEPWCNMRTDKNGGQAYLDYYCTDDPAEGAGCIRYKVINPKGGVWFEMWPPANVSKLYDSGATLEFMARTTDRINSLEFYFQHYKDGEPRQWRMSSTISSSGNASAARQLTPDGRWHKISIPLSEMQYHGCDGIWKERPDDGEPGFDWSCLNWLMITSSGDNQATGKTIYIDGIRINPGTTKTYRQIAFLSSDNIELNGSKPGWNITDPYVVECDADGKFRFSVRFDKGLATWLMFSDGILNGDLSARDASARIPDMESAFPGVIPDDFKDGNAYSSKYLPEFTNKKIPLKIATGQGFQVTGNGQPVVYNIVMPADLSSMTIESVTYPDCLYLYGDATPGGWNLEEVTTMPHIGSGLYRYAGELKAGAPGAFQIYTENPAVCGTDAKAYGHDGSLPVTSWGLADSGLTFYDTGRPVDCYYKVEDGHTNNYMLTVDVVNNALDVLVDNLYITGDITDWQFVRMVNEGNRVFSYTGHFPAGSSFCFTATAGWDVKVAPATDVQFGHSEFSDHTLLFGSQCAMSNNAEGNYIVSADLNNNTFYTRIYNQEITGTFPAVSSDDSTPAVYYNLMGCKVENPSEGLFIRVKNGTADKVIIK